MGNLTIRQQQSLAAELLKTTIDVVEKSSYVVENTKLLMVWVTESGTVPQQNLRGGTRLIVDEKGEVLFCSSTAISNDKMVEEFNNGRRTPLESFKN